MQTIAYSKQLPDAFNKKANSNNARILKINQLAINEFKSDTMDVLNMLDIMQANGETLDLYGDMLQQPRKGADDTKYRYMLLMRIARNLLKGDYDNCVSAIAIALNISVGDVRMIEHETKCAVQFTKFPLEILYNTGFTTVEMHDFLKQLLPIGVELIIDWYDGTFELGAGEGEFDNEKGLADDNKTIGGYLGLAYNEDMEV